MKTYWWNTISYVEMDENTYFDWSIITYIAYIERLINIENIF